MMHDEEMIHELFDEVDEARRERDEARAALARVEALADEFENAYYEEPLGVAAIRIRKALRGDA